MDSESLKQISLFRPNKGDTYKFKYGLVHESSHLISINQI